MVNRLARAGIALTLILAGLLDLVSAGGVGFAPLVAPAAVAAAGMVLVASRDRVARARLILVGTVAGGLSVLLTAAGQTVRSGGAVATWSLLETVSLALLLGVLARRWARGWPTVALVTLTGALVAGPWRLRDPDSAVLSLLVALGALAALAVGLLRRADDLRAAQAVLAARDAERREIARDLHDDAAHHLTGIIVTAQAALAGGSDLAACRDALGRIESTGRQALDSMRGLVGVLRAPDSHERADRDAARWPADLHEALERFGRQTGLTTRISVAEGALPAVHRQAVQRIVQESLTNVTRHADRPTCVGVTVRQQGPAVEVTVSDDGRAATRRDDGGHGTGGGFGLVGVVERAAALGGSASAGRTAEGWCVHVRLPLSLPEHEHGGRR